LIEHKVLNSFDLQANILTANLFIKNQFTMKKITYLLFISLLYFKGFSQSSTILPNQGVSVPQFTTVFIDGMTTQSKGTVVFDKDLNMMKYWNGTAWISLSEGGSGVGWQTTANDISNTNTGNVGIGTASPSYKLDVVGNTNFSGITNITPIISNTSDDGAFKIYSPMTGNTFSGYQFISFDKEAIQARKSGIFPSFIKSEQDLKLNPYGGNVGIGTNSEAITSTLYVIKSANSSGGTAVFKGTTHYTHFHYGTNEDTYIRGGKNTSNVILNDVETSGKVGIGRYPTLYKLEVQGTMKANEVIVESSWADFVFDEKYNLPKLNTVERFIKENKHLPDVPSAEEIQKNGAKLSELTTKMMQKIEELTLYVIQLEKEIDILKAKN
jgi:hypothetical protein